MMWVSIGAVFGHSLCTGVAVIGGRMLASRISVRTGRFPLTGQNKKQDITDNSVPKASQDLTFGIIHFVLFVIHSSHPGWCSGL
jgi:hypothetical protein